MRIRFPNLAFPALGIVLACVASAADSVSTLETKLRHQRADVVRWEVKALGKESVLPDGDVAIVAVGRVGPRTPVRYADGHVRWFSVAGTRPVLVTTRAIDSGNQVQSEDTSAAERDVIALACNPIASIESSQRWRATRRLASGETLCLGPVEQAPEVERDHPVVLRAQRGDVSASRVLTANTDARAGESVRLRDTSSGATVVAIVTGSGTARVLEKQK